MPWIEFDLPTFQREIKSLLECASGKDRIPLSKEEFTILEELTITQQRLNNTFELYVTPVSKELDIDALLSDDLIINNMTAKITTYQDKYWIAIRNVFATTQKKQFIEFFEDADTQIIDNVPVRFKTGIHRCLLIEAGSPHVIALKGRLTMPVIKSAPSWCPEK